MLSIVLGRHRRKAAPRVLLTVLPPTTITTSEGPLRMIIVEGPLKDYLRKMRKLDFVIPVCCGCA